MKISQVELFSVVAILLYMVFFSHSPPYMLRNALGNVFVAGSIFAVLTYITLCHNQTIGVMLILAFLVTMTGVTEHLTGDGAPPSQQGNTSGSSPPPPTNIPLPPVPPGSTPPTGTGNTSQRTGSGVTSTATGTPAPAQATTTPVAPATTTVPTAPAAIPPATAPPTPVMSCNIESFASF
jgi:hypothetical protein